MESIIAINIVNSGSNINVSRDSRIAAPAVETVEST